MIRPAIATLCLVLSISAPQSGAAQAVGDRVLGNYQASRYWFAGVVLAVDGDHIQIRYDDGELDQLPPHQVMAYDWAVGRRIECQFEKTGDWFHATVVALAGTQIEIAYDGGGSEISHTAHCRTRLANHPPARASDAPG